jgi:hypothetical protein
MDINYLAGDMLGAALTFINDDGQEMRYSVHDMYEINGRKYAILTGHLHETVMELKGDDREQYFASVNEHEANALLQSYRQYNG